MTVIALLPLDREIVLRRLAEDDFRLTRTLGGSPVDLHFGPEFPGDAFALYPLLASAASGLWTLDGTYVVVEVATGEVVGQVGTIGAPAEEAEIGYGINASARGRGVATAAVAALLKLLAVRGVRRIVARTARDNPASARVLERNGFTPAGSVQTEEGDLLVWRSAPDRDADRWHSA